MKMPGFTAEASLHSDSNRSRYAMTHIYGAHEPAVFAQLSYPGPPEVSCYYVCFNTPIGWWCETVCTPVPSNGGLATEI